MQPFVGALAITAAFIAGSLVAALGQGALDYVKAFATPAMTLVGAFIGAYLAFQFNRLKDAEAQRRTEHAAANRAVFTLGRQLNRLAAIQADFVDPIRNHPQRHLVMRKVQHQQPLPAIDFDSVAFLLIRGADPNLLGRTSAAEEYASHTLDMLNDRTRLVIEGARLLEQAGWEPQSDWQEEDYAKAMGSVRYHELRAATDRVVACIDAAVEKLSLVSEELFLAICAAFPGERVISARMPAEQRR